MIAMAKFDQGSKQIAEVAGRQLARLAGVECRRWEPLESTLQITLERLADRVFLASQGRERFVVYFEFYTTWEATAPWDMLAKSGLLSQREQLPTVCIPVILRRAGFRSQNGELRLMVGGNPTQQLWYREVCLWQQKPEAWWEDEPGLMALYPLCQHGRQPREAIRHAAQAIERKATLPGTVDEALALLTIFGELAFPSLNIEHLIGSEKMKESRMLRRIRNEEALIRNRAAILRVLRVRFGEAEVSQFAGLLEGMSDPVALEPFIDLAVTCPDPRTFREALQNHGEAT
jgi:hypothetical protein